MACNLHVRRSRGPYGQLMLNGQRLVETDRLNGEIATYFDAGDLKPPLVVYFSGYRTKEGFEGHWMMKKLGCPFLLLTDLRQEGGAFYYGSPILQQAIVKAIQITLQRLNFTAQDLILSGISMGTFGASYYAANLAPQTLLLGKPLFNLGTIAQNSRLNRPVDFKTSLDLQLQFSGNLSQAASQQLDQAFWHHFSQGDFQHTDFLTAYMKNDDYDNQAFPQLHHYLRQHYPEA